jgi:ABC-type polysaccharide/polyol phosphate transport system ATPase subunit
MPPALELRDISVRFRASNLRHRSLKETLVHLFDRQPPATFTAIDNLSLDILDGQSVGLIGRNGAGKSTLLRVMGRIIIPNQGRLVVRRRVVPLLEMGVGFHPEMTGRENCYLAGTLLGFTPTQTREHLPEIIEFSELHEFMDTPVKHYSSGMYARLAFSLLTAVDPEILLLDEVLSVGDEFFQRKSQKRLKNLMDRGAGTVIVSHNLDFLASNCQRLIWLDHGKIVKDGPAAEVASAYREHLGHGPGQGGR